MLELIDIIERIRAVKPRRILAHPSAIARLCESALVNRSPLVMRPDEWTFDIAGTPVIEDTHLAVDEIYLER